jgi:peptidoglycan hydrolase-like protein with peptidoglycan-binding domain
MATLFKRAASVLATVALGAGAAVSTSLPASAATTCRTTFDSYSTVRTGSYGLQPKAAQCLLKWAGYDNTISLRFSSGDAKKLKKFQSSLKLRATGVVNARTWTALLSRGTRPYLHYGSTGPAVKRLQRSLTASGRSVPVTGYFGSITTSAVKSVQRSQGWSATGAAGSGVWRVLQYGIAVKTATTAITSTSSLANRGYTPGTTDPREIARQIMKNKYGFGEDQYSCFNNIIMRESMWDVHATNPSSGAYGIPQALPGSKMATVASDWRTNPATQIIWAIKYMKDRYGSPCQAWGFKRAHGWY